MKSIRKAIILGALSLAAVTRLPAQVAPLASSIEGTISAIELGTNEVLMTVMGVSIRVVRNLETAELITSPTRNLTLEQLSSTVVLPGRTATGFRQGTAIVEGTWNAAANRMEATSVFVEPAENVLLGQVTAAAGGGTVGSINGAPIFMLPVADNTPNTITAGHLLPRVGTTGLRHEVGIPLASIAVGAEVMVVSGVTGLPSRSKSVHTASRSSRSFPSSSQPTITLPLRPMATRAVHGAWSRVLCQTCRQKQI